MIGHLFLRCEADAQGESFLREQSFRAPVHIAKPFTEQGVLVVNLVNPTAGLLDGDSIDCKVSVGAGAKLLLTSPSASRAHRMGAGQAVLSQEFHVAGFLEVLPELFIPQAGARYRQTTRIEVEPGGELIFFESLAPGRVASGEAFAFQRLDWNTELVNAGTKVLKENYTLSPSDLSLYSLRSRWPKTYYGSCFAIGEAFERETEGLREIVALQTESALVGGSRLTQGGWAIKVLAEDSVAFRAVQDRLRRVLYGVLGREMPALRR